MRSTTIVLILGAVLISVLIAVPAIVIAQQNNANNCPNGTDGHATMHGDDWQDHMTQMHGENWQNHMGGNMMGRQGTNGSCH